MAAVPRGKGPSYPLDRRLCGRCGKEKYLCAARNRTLLVRPTELSRLLLAFNFFLIRNVGGGVQTESTKHVGHFWSIVPAPDDCEDGEFGGIKIGRGNRSTRRKPAPAPIYPPQMPLDQTRAWTQAAAVGSQRLTAWDMARHNFKETTYMRTEQKCGSNQVNCLGSKGIHIQTHTRTLRESFLLISFVHIHSIIEKYMK
jgi:hypothetical protein